MRILKIEGDPWPWFVATDVAKALGYSDPHQAVLRHCEGVVLRWVPSAGGDQHTNTIPFTDVLLLASRSHLPDAKVYQRWLFESVVPSIMMTGRYHETPQAPPVPQTPGEALMLAARQTLEVERLAGQVHETLKVIMAVRPCLELLDRVMVDTGIIGSPVA